MADKKVMLIFSIVIFVLTIITATFMLKLVGFVMCLILTLATIGIVYKLLKRRFNKQLDKIDTQIKEDEVRLNQLIAEQKISTKLREDILNARTTERDRPTEPTGSTTGSTEPTGTTGNESRRDEEDNNKTQPEGRTDGSKQLEIALPISNGEIKPANSKPERNPEENWADFS